MLLWIYSIEPPFYAWISEIVFKEQYQYLKMVGPFIRAFSTLLEYSQDQRYNRLGHEILQDEPEHPLGYFCESFVVFRGVSMRHE